MSENALSNVNVVNQFIKWIHPNETKVNLCWMTSSGIQGSITSKKKAIEDIETLKNDEDIKAIWLNVHKSKDEARSVTTRWNANDMERYQFLALDFDAKPSQKGFSATDEEWELTVRQSAKANNHLIANEWKVNPTIINTGNGVLLLYPIDVQANEENKARLHRLGEILASQFNHLDVAPTADVARIFGVAGTWNRNKKTSEDRPHRLRDVIRYSNSKPMSESDFIAWADSYIKTHDDIAEDVEPSAKPTTANLSNDKDERIVKALTYCDKVPGAVEGHNGDEATFKLAGHVLAFGLTVDEATDVMMKRWNEKCNPPWAYDDLRAKVASASKNGTPRASKHIEMKADANVVKPITTNGLISMSDVKAKRIEWLWKNFIPTKTLTIIAGNPGCNKSTIALDIASHVTNGLPFADGSICPKGSVLLLSAEDDPSSITKEDLKHLAQICLKSSS